MPETSNSDFPAAPAIVESRRRISIVWLIPAVAVCIAIWLLYRAMSEQGPQVSIVFKAAEGIVAGKTVIKLRDVEVGKVESVSLSEDLSEVNVVARLDRALEHHLTADTTFWVVRPQLTGGRVLGLDTVLSGVYIAINPGPQGQTGARQFRALTDPPALTVTTPGRYFVLQATSLGSLDVGSPIYYRKLSAGRVTSFGLSKGGAYVAVRVFVDQPFDALVNTNTRFWNASGVSASMSAEGITLQTESLSAILAGGIAFETPLEPASEEAVADDHVFVLHDNREAATARPVDEVTERLVMHFDGSVRGLRVGAPLEFRGIRMGEVVDINTVSNLDDLSLGVAVLLEYSRDRVKLSEQLPGTDDERLAQFNRLVRKGLRGQLKPASLLTGQLFVDLDFHPQAPAAQATAVDGVVVLPTIPGAFEELRADAEALLGKLQALPLEQIGADLRAAASGLREIANAPAARETLALLRDAARGASELSNSTELRESLTLLHRTLRNSDKLMTEFGSRALPRIEAVLEQSTDTLTLLRSAYVKEDSPVYRELTRALAELNRAARSIRLMADYLERHPDSLIKGKAK